MAPEIDFKDYIGQQSLKKAAELNEQLSRELFIGTDTGVPYRSINHWEKVGLIDNRRDENKKWRRFSFVEFVWIRMIDQLRQIGVSIDAIKAVKEMLLNPTPLIDLWTLMADLGDLSKLTSGNLSDEEQREFQQFFERLLEDPPEGEETISPLQLLIATSIAKRCPVIVIVFPDGDSFWLEEHSKFFLPPEYRDRLSFEPHARISVTGIIKEYLAGDLAFERNDNLNILEENEMFLLNLIHSGEYESIKVNFKEKKMNSLELVKSQDAAKKIVDVLAEGDYQDITIVTHKGRISRIENTLKIKLD